MEYLNTLQKVLGYKVPVGHVGLGLALAYATCKLYATSHSSTLSGETSDDAKMRKLPINREQFPNYLKNEDGLWIHTQRWLTTNAKAVVFLVHGLGEHCGRYEHFARRLNAEGFDVYSMDHQGHGLSDGTGGYVEKFEHFVRDYIQFVNSINVGNKTRFLIGHSMGGLIGAHVAIQTPHLWSKSGVVLSGPLIVADPATGTPTMKVLAKVFSALFPKLVLDTIKTSQIATDKQVCWRYGQDKLNDHEGVRARMGAELMRGMDSIKDQMSGFEHPLLLLLASKDKLCFPAGGRMFFEGVASEDKTLREFKELEHELLNETKRAHVHDTVVDWLNERMEKEIELAINDSSDSINTLTKRK